MKVIGWEAVSLEVCRTDVNGLGMGVVTSDGPVDSAATPVEGTRDDVFEWNPVIADPVLNE